MLGFGALGESALGELPLTPLQKAVEQLQHAITMAPKDPAAAARHIELAAPYFGVALKWSRKVGRPELPPDRRSRAKIAAYAEQYSPEAAAAEFGVKVATVEKYLRERGRGQ